MPANLTPQYIKAEKEFKAARTIEEKIACMENMLALIPKHKGTDHMQADLKHRLAQLRREQVEGHAAGKRAAPVYKIEKGGAGQVILLGPPNAGKSQLLKSLTNATVVVAEYPFTTQVPQPGMARFEDVQIQLVDTPAVTEDYFEVWLPDLVRRADAALLVADLGDEGLLDALEVVIRRLEAVKVCIVGEAPAGADEDLRTFRRTAIVANKMDLPGATDRLEVLREFYSGRFEIWPVSGAMGEGLQALPARLFDFLRLIRVYTKEPGKKADLAAPYTLPAGSTVLQLAISVHREFEQTLKSARIWGSGKYEGIYVKRDHLLQDKDVVELHE
ncbi:MAG: GTPase [Candidatus Brocadiia bacterium]|jgi:ribosome-interacting GTPase 1